MRKTPFRSPVPTTRRQFFKSGLGSVAGMTLSPAIALATERATTIPIGSQLYTVRGELARNVTETLKKLGQIGYQGVEFWDYAGTPIVYQSYSAPDLRRILDDSGLKCCGMHVKKEALSSDKLKITIETNQLLGNTYINLAAVSLRLGGKKLVFDAASIRITNLPEATSTSFENIAKAGN